MNDMIGGKYFRNGDVAKHCYDCNMCGETEWCHNSLVADYSYMVGFSLFCRESKFCLYCDNCNSCDDCFGCMSLRKSQYSILNREYSKDAYMVLRERIIEHMKKTGE